METNERLNTSVTILEDKAKTKKGWALAVLIAGVLSVVTGELPGLVLAAIISTCLVVSAHKDTEAAEEKRRRYVESKEREQKRISDNLEDEYKNMANVLVNDGILKTNSITPSFGGSYYKSTPKEDNRKSYEELQRSSEEVKSASKVDDFNFYRIANDHFDMVFNSEEPAFYEENRRKTHFTEYPIYAYDKGEGLREVWTNYPVKPWEYPVSNDVIYYRNIEKVSFEEVAKYMDAYSSQKSDIISCIHYNMQENQRIIGQHLSEQAKSTSDSGGYARSYISNHLKRR